MRTTIVKQRSFCDVFRTLALARARGRWLRAIEPHRTRFLGAATGIRPGVPAPPNPRQRFESPLRTAK